MCVCVCLGEYGLQPPCNNDDTSQFNICLDLTSTNGVYESWMDTAIAAAARWEQVIVGDLPFVDTGASGQLSRPVDLSEDCTVPTGIDDIYICIQNVQLDDGVVGFAGPFLSRTTDDMNDRTSQGLPYAGRVAISNAALDDGDEDLTNYMIHEISHALGFPAFLPEEEESNLYATDTNADDAWKAIGCNGQIPIQMGVQGHWDETCLVDEIMTPIVFQGTRNQLSNITVAAMADLGYKVNYNAADAFTSSNLGMCGASCPETGSSGGGRRLESAPRHRELSDQAKMAVMYDFKDDLLYFREVRLPKPGRKYIMRFCYLLMLIPVFLISLAAIGSKWICSRRRRLLCFRTH